MRLALATPLPPSTSGIADHAAELAPRLARGCELELFFEGRRPPAEAPGGLRCRPLADLAAALDRERFDGVIYEIGNSAPHHEEIYRTLLERPGIVVLHEYMLHHLVRELTLARGDAAGYVEEMRYAAGRSGERAARRLLDTHHPVDVWSFPLFERVVDRSLGLLVHSRFARERVLASRPRARVAVVPLAVDLDANRPLDAAERARARRAVGVPEDGPLLASFGFVTPQKHLEPALAAFARLRRERPAARLALVGEVSRHYDLEEVLDRRGRDGVLVTGRVAPAALADWMAACDVAVNLRHPTGGETSATLVRLLALGRPVVVTDAGSFAELPDGVVAKVGTGPEEEEHLLELFRRLAVEPELAAALGRAARRHAEREHGLDVAARGYHEFVAETLAAGGGVAEAVPPLAPWRADDAWIGLVAGLGADLADLGVGEGDDEALGEIAARLVELGLDRSPA